MKSSIEILSLVLSRKRISMRDAKGRVHTGYVAGFHPLVRADEGVISLECEKYRVEIPVRIRLDRVEVQNPNQELSGYE
jgi:hypothetical protein